MAAFWIAGSALLGPGTGQGPVVIYLVDTLRYDRMSAYGAKRPTTPAAERLAREGVRYDAAYSVASWTRPAVASLFTSRWPAEVGAVGRWGALTDRIPVMPAMFLANGWATAAFCGQPNIYAEELGFRRGFTTFVSIPARGDAVDGGVATADSIVEPAIRWIESRRDPRFFLFVHVVDPHNGMISVNPNPYRHWIGGYENLFSRAPMDLDSRDWRLAKYDALVRQADDQFARLRAALEKKHFWKKALVVYLADHGEEFYEHGSLYHGQSLFEELVHIPLIVKGPGWGRPGEVEKLPVSLIDLLPSLAHWSDLPSDRSWRGTAIDGTKPNPRREIYFSEELDFHRQYGMRRGSMKMIASVTPPFRVQFDLARDPGEENPVLNDSELTRRLEQYRRREIASYGGITIWKKDRGAATIRGFIDLPDGEPAYLTLLDRERYPIDPKQPNRLPIAVTVGENQDFEAHFDTLDGVPGLTAHLTVSPRGPLLPITVGFRGRIGPFEVRVASIVQLSPAEMSEISKKMRALGYLGGGGAE